VKEALARLSAAWANLPQSTKLLLAGLLLVSAVSLWYVGFYLPAQAPGGAQVPATGAPVPPPAAQETPQALEAPPIPPLSEPTQPPKVEPAPPKEATPAPAPQAQPAPLPLPQARQEAPPPNPFVPLFVGVGGAPEAPPAPSPTPAVRPTPVPTGTPVRVSPGTPLATPSLPTAPRPLPGTAGALPTPKVLRPALKAEVPQARVEPPVEVAPPLGLVEVPLPEAQVDEGAPAPEAPPVIPPSPPKSPLAALVEEKGLRLSGTLLGPVSVAILESKEGYLVLPVGSPIPGSEAVIRRIEGDRVVLLLKEETLEIPLADSQAGGER
jgi:hypothetical protein